MDNLSPFLIMTSKSKPSNFFSLKNFGIFCLAMLIYYAIGYVIQDPYDLTAPRKPFDWFFLFFAIFMYIFSGLQFTKNLYKLMIFKDYLLAEIGNDKANLHKIEPKHLQSITLIGKMPKKPKFKLVINTQPCLFPDDLADYHYDIRLDISPTLENNIKKNAIYFNTQSFEQQDILRFIDWLKSHDIPTHQYLQPQGEDIGYMPLILMLVGVIGGIAVWSLWDTIGSARHLVGNYAMLWGIAGLISLMISVILIKRQKKAYWLATAFIATVFLTPMFNGILMKGYELAHEKTVHSQNLTPDYRFEFALDKSEAEKQTWQLARIYQKHSTEFIPVDTATQAQFRDLMLRATPNNPLWQANIGDKKTLNVPVYKIGDDWFFYPDSVN